MADTSASRLSRLLALVPWLMAHDGVSMQAAATHFQITPEQLEKDLFLLIVSGLPGHGPADLIDIQFWDDGRIHVLDPQTIDRPLRLNGEEATALLVALRLLAQVPGDHDRAAIRSATIRLEQALGATGDVAVVAAVDPLVREAVDTAIASQRALQIAYASASADAVTVREIEPMAIHSMDGQAYVEAYCRTAGAVRTFRLDRIHSVAVLDDPLPPEASGDDTRAVEPTTVIVRLDPNAPWAAELLAGDALEPSPDGWQRVRVGVFDPAWLVRAILGLQGAAVVEEPAQIRQAVADAARAALASYA